MYTIINNVYDFCTEPVVNSQSLVGSASSPVVELKLLISTEINHEKNIINFLYFNCCFFSWM